MAISYLACMVIVSGIYHLPPRVLPTIQAIEGGKNGSIRGNVNGSHDLGVMQINTIWVSALSRYTERSPSTVEYQLVNNACYNIAAAGLILRTYLNQSGGNLMVAVGDYHSHTPLLNNAYQKRVLSQAWKIFERAR